MLISPRPQSSQEWEARVTRQIRHQACIEAAFDRADEAGRLGDFPQALDWLETADQLSGGLPPAYLRMRARWTLRADAVRFGARSQELSH